MFRLCFVPALLIAAPAFAQQSAPPALELVGEIELLSDYRYRGVSRSDEDPALRGALGIHHVNGLYASARATSLRGRDLYRNRDLGDLQGDLHAGWRGPIGGGFELEAGGSYTLFAGGEADGDYGEALAALGYQLGPANLGLGLRYAPAQAGTGGRDMVYAYGRGEIAIPFRPWAFSAELGRQDSGAFGDYWHWQLGVRHQLQVGGLPNTELGLDYVDTDLANAPGRDAGIVLSVRLGF